MRARTLTIVAVALLAGLGVYLFTGPRHMDPKARIVSALNDAASAAERRDVSGVMAVVGDDFHGHGLDRQQLGAYLFAELRRASWRKVKLMGIDVELTSDTTAEVHTRALLMEGSGMLPSGASRYQLALGMKREGGDWKVVSAQWARVSG